MVLAFANAQLKPKEETIHYLEVGYWEHLPDMVRIQNDSNYDSVHSDPRHSAIVNEDGAAAGVLNSATFLKDRPH